MPAPDRSPCTARSRSCRLDPPAALGHAAVRVVGHSVVTPAGRARGGTAPSDPEVAVAVRALGAGAHAGRLRARHDAPGAVHGRDSRPAPRGRRCRAGSRSARPSSRRRSPPGRGTRACSPCGSPRRRRRVASRATRSCGGCGPRRWTRRRGSRARFRRRRRGRRTRSRRRGSSPRCSTARARSPTWSSIGGAVHLAVAPRSANAAGASDRNPLAVLCPNPREPKWTPTQTKPSSPANRST